jgi:predicted TIM-barrel fold metal-dependent hydrolase
MELNEKSGTAEFTVPRGTCDCHTHVFIDDPKFPFAKDRKYTPPFASVGELSGLMAEMQVDRVVVVQPSVYGTDNAATLEALRVLGPQRARGVAVIDSETSEEELDRLDAAGVRGVRVNLELSAEADPSRCKEILKRVARQIAGRDWHIQIYSQLLLIAAMREVIADLSVPVVLDHFARTRGVDGPDQPGFSEVLDLLKTGNVYVKLSAPYRCSNASSSEYSDMLPIAQALIAAKPDRLVWGSDWPHPEPVLMPGNGPNDVNPAIRVDDLAVFRLMARWAPDANVRRKILVDNPARLYGFQPKVLGHSSG